MNYLIKGKEAHDCSKTVGQMFIKGSGGHKMIFFPCQRKVVLKEEYLWYCGTNANSKSRKIANIVILLT